MNTQLGDRTERVLIVDDEENLRITLSDIIQNEGYSVDVAASGEEAVKLCSEQGYDIVLLDVRMPGMDGVEAFYQTRRYQGEVAIIMMSACGIDNLGEAAFDGGVVELLSKPLDVDNVVKLISEVVHTD